MLHNYYTYYNVSIIIIIIVITTLESVPLKVFTSYLRYSYQFFENNYIESKIQKGFTPKISGALEHTSQMANAINKAHIR